MNHSEKPDRELADLITSWHDGDLTEAEGLRLTERLESEPAARRAFREAARFEAMLHLEFPDSVVHFPVRERAWFQRKSILLAIAACTAMVAQPVYRSLMESDLPSPEVTTSADGKEANRTAGSLLMASTPVARVSALRDAVASPGSLPLSEHALLPPGNVQLESGVIELTFFSGARVTLQAPCKMELKSDFRATLERGELTAQVPSQAIGFTIYTPTGQLRDLGTSFAVNVDQTGDADVHVLDGKVEAISRSDNSLVTLTESQATRISAGHLTPIRFRADGWPATPDLTSVPPLPDSVHWSLDRFEGDMSLDANGVHPLWMRSAVNASANSDRLIKGPIGQALSFNGKGEFAESTYRGVSGNRPRAVSMWLRIPPDASYDFPNGIVAWGTVGQSKKWQVAWNNGDQGTLGALRVEFGDGYVIGTTDLRDGLWHHIAGVYLGGNDSNVASHVKLYVDGRLETLSGRRGQLILTDTDSARAIAVTLGRWLGHWRGKAPFYFRGALDDIRIFEGALTPDQVAGLAKP